MSIALIARFLDPLASAAQSPNLRARGRFFFDGVEPITHCVGRTLSLSVHFVLQEIAVSTRCISASFCHSLYQAGGSFPRSVQMRVFIADDSSAVVELWRTCWRKYLERSL